MGGGYFTCIYEKQIVYLHTLSLVVSAANLQLKISGAFINNLPQEGNISN